MELLVIIFHYCCCCSLLLKSLSMWSLQNQIIECSNPAADAFQNQETPVQVFWTLVASCKFNKYFIKYKLTHYLQVLIFEGIVSRVG